MYECYEEHYSLPSPAPSPQLQPMTQVMRFGEGRDEVTHPGTLQVSERISRSHGQLKRLSPYLAGFESKKGGVRLSISGSIVSLGPLLLFQGRQIKELFPQ